MKATSSTSKVRVRSNILTSGRHRLTITGVVYAREAGASNSGFDVLANPDQCQIDAGLMNTLGVNTIRVYSVDATRNHDACMQAFESQGIYVWVDLSSPMYAINRVGCHWLIFACDALKSAVLMHSL